MESKLMEGMLVSTGFQTRGRGQKDNEWHSTPGLNALFSLYLTPKFLDTAQLNTLSFAVGLGLRAAIQQLVPKAEVKLKWPNDVLVDSQKICGILIENMLGAIPRSIVGIGINVNQSSFWKLANTTSLLKLLGRKLDVNEVVNLACEFVEKYYLLAKEQNGVQQIHQLYVSQLYKLNEQVEIDSELWHIVGVDSTGKLELRRDMEEIKLVHNEANIAWS